jgi:uncharacterized protein (DUF488 family)
MGNVTTTLRTLGHGALGAEDFAALCRSAGIEVVADVRRFPGSRRHPHFGSEAMAAWLAEGGVGYRWMAALGGRRRPSPDSPNVALRNPQFRAYADHMATGEFGHACAELLELARSAPVTVLCAESVWWRCHRRLLADHLVVVAGVRVEHLFHDGRLVAHTPSAEARLVGDHLVYDLDGQPPLFTEPGRAGEAPPSRG